MFPEYVATPKICETPRVRLKGGFIWKKILCLLLHRPQHSYSWDSAEVVMLPGVSSGSGTTNAKQKAQNNQTPWVLRTKPFHTVPQSSGFVLNVLNGFFLAGSTFLK